MRNLGVLIVSLLFLVSMLSFVSAEKIDVIPIKDVFSPGENIAFRVPLLDSNNNPINANIEVVAEDASKKTSVGKTAQANTLVELGLGENSPPGYWKITAKYSPQGGEPLSASAIFMVELSEIVKFEIKEGILVATNVGNIRYTKEIQIVIGDSIGSKQLNLGVGESTSFRLIAPDGTYNVRVTDGKTTITQSSVALTGNVIGILDNEERAKSPITTAVGGEPQASGDNQPSSLFRSNALVYMFLVILFAAVILLSIERRFKSQALPK